MYVYMCYIVAVDIHTYIAYPRRQRISVIGMAGFVYVCAHTHKNCDKCGWVLFCPFSGFCEMKYTILMDDMSRHVVPSIANGQLVSIRGIV